MQEKTRELAYIALMSALIFTATYLIKIPNPATGGYTHMGDCMIFVSVMLLGKKQGALAAGIGGALSDLLSGAAIWVVPTFVIKYAMAYFMGWLIERQISKKGILAAIAGGLFQSIAYTLIKIPLVGMVPAIASIPRVLLQSAIGVFIFAIVLQMLPQGKNVTVKGVRNV